MKTNIITIAIAIAALVIAAFAIKGCSDARTETNQISDALRVSKEETVVSRDKNGQLVSRTEQMQLTIGELKKNGNDLGLENSILKKSVGNLNNLVAYYKGQINTSGHGEVKASDTVFVEINNGKADTVKAKKIGFNNQHLWLDGIYTDNTFKFDYKYKISFSYISYWKRPDKFKVGQLFSSKVNAKKLIIDMRFDDPNAYAVDVKALTILPPKKKFWETNVFKYTVGAALGGYGTYKVFNAIK